MFVSGPIGAMATGSGCSRSILAMSSTAPSGTAVAVAGGSCVAADAALPVDLGRPHDLADERTGGTLGDRDVVASIGVEETQRVLRAVADVGVPAHRGDGQDVELGARQGQADRHRVVEPRIAVDDQRQR